MKNLFQPPVIYSLIINGFAGGFTHQAAPTTDREMARPMPRPAHMKGDVSVRNLRAKTETNHSTISLHSSKTPWSWSYVCISILDFIFCFANCDIMQLRKICRVCKALRNIFVKKAKNIQKEMWLKFHLCLRNLKYWGPMKGLWLHWYLILHINDFSYKRWKMQMFWFLF